MRAVIVTWLALLPVVAGQCSDGSGTSACGYNCDDNCNCGHCNTAPGCQSEDQCLGSCNSGNNAKFCPTAPAPTPPPAPTPSPSPAPAGQCSDGTGTSLCGYNCDDNCNCGHCNTAPGCQSEDQCLGNCNGGNNAKFCPGAPAPTPPPAPTPSPSPAPTPTRDFTCKNAGAEIEACGYNCDDNCNCGRCNTKAGCMNPDSCLGTCNGGGNAKWCGKAPPPPPPAPPVPAPAPPSTWSTANARLQRNGKDVVLHGFGTTCTEYLLRGMGMQCFVKYNWPDPSNVMPLDTTQLNPIIDNLLQVTDASVVPTVRIPLTASSWLGVNTSASAENLAKYPELGKQYQGLISDMVDYYTKYGIVTILDLHWTDDDTDNTQPMSGKAARGSADCVDFWDSVASTFASNTMVFYELYNEPHRVDLDVWMNGDTETAGMLEMMAAVRKHTTAPVIIAGGNGYAYDSDSLITLDGFLNGDKNVIYNFHPYMGPNQAGDSKKCPANFETYLTAVLSATGKPAIVTEFGQGCNPTHGAAEQCEGVYDGTTMGYDETIVTIADKHAVSWLPWAWKGTAKGPNGKNCQDMNGGDEFGNSLYTPTDDKGGDFAGIWSTFGNKGLPSSLAV